MKKLLAIAALPLIALVFLFLGSESSASDLYRCTIISTDSVSRNMADAGPGVNGPACGFVTAENVLAVQCNVATCVATGNNYDLTAACVFDGGAGAQGVLVQANAVYDVKVGYRGGNLATITPNGGGTSTCKIYNSAP